MPPRFPTGQIHACPEFLEVVPRSAMIAAISAHVLTERPIPDGKSLRSDHRHGGVAFRIETCEDRSRTHIRLATVDS